MTVIVTGGAGFIGSNLIRGLNARGITDILVVDNLGSSSKFNLRTLSVASFSNIYKKIDFVTFFARND